MHIRQFQLAFSLHCVGRLSAAIAAADEDPAASLPRFSVLSRMRKSSASMQRLQPSVAGALLRLLGGSLLLATVPQAAIAGVGNAEVGAS